MIIKTKIYDITDVLKDSNSNLIKKSISSGNKIYAIKLDNFAGLLGYELLPGRRIGTELADVAKRFGFKGLIHSDELPKYGIEDKDIEAIRNFLNCDDNCAFIFILSKDYDKAKLAFTEIVARINDMLNGVPKDTRQAREDGTTMFLRPQPGAARMYPETDHPLIKISKNIEDKGDYEIIEYKIFVKDEVSDELKMIRLKKLEPELYLKLKKQFSDMYIINALDPNFRRKILRYIGVKDDAIINNILRSEYIDIFEEYYNKVSISTIYYIIFQLKGEVKREYNIEVEIDKYFVRRVLELLSENKITKKALIKILYHYYTDKKEVDEVIKIYNLWKIPYEEVVKKVRELISSKNIDISNKRKLINTVMSELLYIAEPKDVLRAIDEIVKDNT